MSTDLSTLSAAAERWDGMAKEFHKQETAYRRDVHGISMGQTWIGLSADAANRRFDITLNEFLNAQVEAKAVAALFREAHTQFVDLHKKLKAARDEAVAAGMKVSDQGVVSYDASKLTQGDRQALAHDPDYQRSVGKSVNSWQQRIDQCVKDVDDADKGVEVALKAVVIDSDTNDGTVNGFNGKAKGDIEKYEADEAKAIVTRIDSGKATAADYKELQRIFHESSRDEAFSQTLLDELGARRTLKLSNDLESLGHYDDKKNAGRYRDLEHGLAATLAAATRDPHSSFYKRFRAQMQKAGTEQFNVEGLSRIPDEKVRGYQSLVTLMQQGRGYSGQFLEDTADDIRHSEESYAAEGNTESIWSLRDNFSGKNRGWFANDPLDGVLGIMSKDPKTSTEYLDPAQNDNLKYLLHERDWQTVVDHYATPPGGTTTGMPVTVEDADVRKGFGAALEAATTGDEPGSYHAVGKHTEPQARILQHTINTLDSDKHAEQLPKNLAKPLAHILTSYTPDTHETYARSSSTYDIDKDSPGAVWSDKEGTHMAVGSRHLVAVMRGIADDPEAFGHLYGAEQQYSHQVLADIPRDAGDKTINDRIVESSRAMGAYDGIRSDIIYDDRFKKTQWAADFNHGIGTSFSTALLFNPVADVTPAGTLASQAIDAWTYESNKEHVAEANLEATEKNAEAYDAGQRDVEKMVRAWADSRGHGIDSDWTKFHVHAGQDQYGKGRDDALRYLRPDR
ncbi:hypothetical protein AB0I49_33745 [Streptomyces sp. NPDC050617]|uniref:hypothetical protein n=1 Tax=Streptomyces sp. NPDC050617 TaxID=3154628 RepID=UPI00343F580A